MYPIQYKFYIKFFNNIKATRWNLLQRSNIKRRNARNSNNFSFTEEIVINSARTATTRKVYYSFDLKTVRYDTYATKKFRENAPIKIIHDFNSGN